MKPKTKRYPQIIENEWVYPKLRDYHYSCCDCGLVHSMDFDIVLYGSTGRSHEGIDLISVVPIDTMAKDAILGIRMRARREDRRTAQLRRHRKHRRIRH